MHLKLPGELQYRGAVLAVLMLVLGLGHEGCILLKPLTKTIPKGYGPLRFDMDVDEALNAFEQLRSESPTHYYVEDPSDEINRIDVFFTPQGGEIAEIIVTYYPVENQSFSAFVSRFSSRYGPPDCMEDGVRSRNGTIHDTAEWRRPGVNLLIRGNYYTKDRKRFVPIIRITNTSIAYRLARQAREALIEQKRELIRHGDY